MGRLIPPWAKLFARMRLVTWNSQGLVSVDRRLLARKLGSLRQLSGANDIVCLQEVHGDRMAMQTYFHHFSETQFAFFHPCSSGRAGGVAFLVAKSFCSEDTTLSSSSLIAGRAALLRICSAGHELMILNVHNFVTAVELPVLIRLVRALVAESKSDPTKKSLFLVGDLNISAMPVRHVAELASHADSTIRASDDKPPPSSVPRLWKPLLDDLIEIFQDMPTRFGSATGSISILDRCFTSLQP